MYCECLRSRRNLLHLCLWMVIGIGLALPDRAPAQLVWQSPKLPASSLTARSSPTLDGGNTARWESGTTPATGQSRSLSVEQPIAEKTSVRQTSLVEGESDKLFIEKKPEPPEVIPTPEAINPEEVQKQPRIFAPQMGDQLAEPQQLPIPFGPMEMQAPPCDECYPWGPGGNFDNSELFRDGLGVCLINALSGFSFFAGIHGFKGPVDLGQNGNFGFHEGLNFGGPLGDPWGFGYQLGAQAVHSDLTGFRVDPANGGPLESNGRDQIFFTGGIFRRAVCGGLQSGVVFDYLHDNYYDKADLRQIRSETSYVFRDGVSEIGYWGAYGVNRERFIIPTRPSEFVFLQSNDIFAAFYRRHFTGGGQGRLWAGATGAGQGILGGEATVPLGTSWALENNFVYVIPKNSAANGGQVEEHWSVTINLVWYPGRAARGVFKNPFHPLLGVGDNSAFLIRR